MDAADVNPRLKRVARPDGNRLLKFGSRPRLVGGQPVQRAVGTVAVVPAAVVVEVALEVAGRQPAQR